MSDIFDVLIIGAGVAGASLGARLSRTSKKIILEAEDHPGYHSTGRSAAIYVPDHGPQAIRALTSASLSFLQNPPTGFCDGDILSPRGFVFVAKKDETKKLDALLSDAPSLDFVDQKNLNEIMPELAEGRFVAGAYSKDTMDIDVDRLHQGYLSSFKANNGLLKCKSRVTEISKTDGYWLVKTKFDTYKTKTIVNAAGAWGDEVGILAGCEPIGLVPKKRTAAIVKFSKKASMSWPMVVEIDENWYFQPAGDYVFVSPADEQSSVPCDAWADDMDVATVVDNVSHALDAEPVSVESSWAGLRSFCPDGVISIGYDNSQEGFFWLVGQGGYGIESSPAVSLLAAHLIEKKAIDPHLEKFGVDPTAYSPARFQKGI